MPSIKFLTVLLLLVAALVPCFAGDANRLTYLDESDPFYVGVKFPKLTTPQWIGEEGVDAVVTFGVDDMRGNPQKYETFLRPILERLRQIDGRTPVSIFCNAIAPEEPMVQRWLAEGLSIEVHTLSHPCPILAKGNFQAAFDTFHGCVDLLNHIQGNVPVAFRTPCCDSINSPSPRLYAEIFNRTTGAGQFLQADSSVMNILSANDPALPRALVMDADGKEKFRKYVPFPSFVTTIENYPYPYVIGKLCWEFPAMVPSDWEAQHVHGTNNPVTVADWKAGLDATVLKQGIFNFIFHPHGWIASTQMVEFIDYAVQKYGPRVKFLNYREAIERLNKNLLAGEPLRATNGQDNGVRLMDVNNDGYLDVIVGNDRVRKTRVWKPSEKQWRDTDFPVALVTSASAGRPGPSPGGAAATSVPLSSSNEERAGVRSRTSQTADPTPHPGPLPVEGRGSGAARSDELSLGRDAGVRFGVVGTNGFATVLVTNEQISGAWQFDGNRWIEAKAFLAGLDVNAEPVFTSRNGRDQGVRLRDLDNDGRCELLVGNETQNAVFTWSDEDRSWRRASFELPTGTSIVDAQGRDNGLRFADINGDGFDDAVFSNAEAWSVHLFLSAGSPRLGWDRGWSFKVSGGKRGEPGEIPMMVRAGTNRNNGAWFHSKQLWVQNEETAQLPDLVDRRSFASLVTGAESPAKSPPEELQSFQVRPGFKIELVASEPLVVDPVAFEWGADGKLWVAEMRDYPSGIDGQGKAGGVIKFLEDTDGDGRYDKATVFMEGVNFPNGVMPWRKGLLVSAAPEIFYAEDTDGDGKADVKRTLLVGFREGNQQHRINGFDYGLDGWVYAANGESGGTVTNVAATANAATAKLPLSRPADTLSPSDGEGDGIRGRRSPALLAGEQKSLNSSAKSGNRVLPSVKDLRGYDLRLDPDTGDFELVAGQTQFGRHRDDWGNWFGNNNPNWLWHYFVPIEFLSSHPPPEWKSTRYNLANYPERNRVFAISNPQRRFNWPEAIREVTSANSATPYRDELFGPDFSTSIFMSEPANNVVHREVVEYDGVTFKSHRAADEQDREFVASTDNWFRPTMLKTGPDGALYISDMYRLVIEHPEYFPEELKSRPDLRAGEDKGRIWRVYPEGVVPRAITRLDKLDTAGLIAALDSPNGWQRDTAQRLLTEQAAKSLNAGVIRERLLPKHIDSLSILAAKSRRAKTRVQALTTLATLGELRSAHVMAALRDEDANVRATALRVIEADFSFRETPSVLGRLNVQDSQKFLVALTRLTNDPSSLVRFQLALTLGRRGGAVTNALATMALHETDSNVQSAILNAVGAQPTLRGPGVRPGDILAQVLASPNRNPWVTRLLSHLVRIVFTDENWPPALERLMNGAGSPQNGRVAPWQMEVAAGLLDGLEAGHGSLSALRNIRVESIPWAIKWLKPVLAYARQTAGNAAEPEPERLASIRLLGRGESGRDGDVQMLASLLKPAAPTACQNAALDALKRLHEPNVPDALIAAWAELSPSLRPNVLNALLGRDEWTDKLVAALEKGILSAAEIAPVHQQALLKQKGDAVRQRSEKLFAAQHTDRQQVVRNYESVKELTPNPGRGALLYRQNCATCHRLKGEGNEVGPDLGTVADKPLGTLLVAVLDPNQAFETKYVSYTAATRRGREITGIIASETPNSVTIRSPGGAEEIVARSDIQSLASSKLSLMPEGLENVLSAQDMADLIAFIRSK